MRPIDADKLKEYKCSTCGKPSLPGKKLCERCNENACRTLDKGRQKLRDNGYDWSTRW